MLQRSSMTTMAATAEVAESFRDRLRDEQLAALRRAFALPSTLRGFIFFVLGLAVIGAGLATQVMLSAQIRQVEVQNDGIRTEVVRIEQHNAEIMWAIAQASALGSIERRARELGFVSMDEPRFVVRAADAPAYFGTAAGPVEDADLAATTTRLPYFGQDVDGDLTGTSGIVSFVRQRVAESIEQLVR